VGHALAKRDDTVSCFPTVTTATSCVVVSIAGAAKTSLARTTNS
jgi:hypothetical protein